ncbi:MAG TPA: hypothetical protein VEA63_00135, partial [Opitutus sp.]|nr:hypothetical protein [Opitutus sp.]
MTRHDARKKQAATEGCRYVVFALACCVAVAAAADLPPGIEAFDFAPRAERTGPTLFSRIDASVSGVHAPSIYDDPAMWTERFERFAYGSMGTGVAIGDY